MMEVLKLIAIAGLAGGGLYVALRMRGDGGQETYTVQQASQTSTTGPDWGGLLGTGLSLLGGLVGSAPDADGVGVQAAASGDIKPLTDVIKDAESNGDYNIVYHGSKLQPAQPITTMRVRDVRAWQAASVSAGSASSAAGAYQIIKKTMASLVNAGVLDNDEYFDRDAQDRAAVYLARGRGLDEFLRGDLNIATFGNRLAREWAGLPLLSGPNAGWSYYDGDGLNGASVTVAQVVRALEAVRGVS